MLQATTWARVVPEHEPEQDRDDRRGQPVGGQGVRRRAEQHPGLEEPGDVERGHEECAQVVGGGADGEGDALLAGEEPRPPPDATDETMVSSRNATKAVGSSNSTSRARPAL